MKPIFCLILVSLLFFSCKKDKKTPIVEPTVVGCPEMYDARSTPYLNPYMGTISPQTPIPPDDIYPERYEYWHPCTNPNNNYEIAYCRKDHKTKVIDLYTYNFCTGKTTLLTTNVLGWPDWSVKNWIIFASKSGNLWKIKPNGDSLTQVTGAYRSKWSKDGTKYAWSGGQIFDENGTLLYTIPYYVYLWKSNTEIISGAGSSNGLSFEIFVVDITTNTKTKSITIPMGGLAYIYALHKDDLYFSISSSHNNGNLKHYSMNINTLDTTFRYELPPSFFQNITSSLNNKILLQQVLRDTMTGTPYYLNYRSHVAIMNLDGTNERQVLIPE